MNKYQCEYLVISLILLICYTSSEAEQLEYVTRSSHNQFGSLLCSPETYISIRAVHVCASTTSHCTLTGSGCDVAFPENHEYYQRVVSECNGRVACAGLYPWRERMKTPGDCYGRYLPYTTLEYQCLPVTQDDQGAHYHHHVIKCSESPFPDLTCPDNTYINVTEVLLGSGESSSVSCTAQPEDCVESYLKPQTWGLANCSGLTECSGLDIYQVPSFLCEGTFKQTDYMLLLYQCLQNPSDVHYTCLSDTANKYVSRNLTAPEGTVVSPGYPGNYYDVIRCAFGISAPINYKVEIRFEMMHLKGNYLCYDYLQVYDGFNDEEPLLGTLCGDTLPEPITSTGNGLFISFYSDAWSNERGFIFVWRFIEMGKYQIP